MNTKLNFGKCVSVLAVVLLSTCCCPIDSVERDSSTLVSEWNRLNSQFREKCEAASRTNTPELRREADSERSEKVEALLGRFPPEGWAAVSNTDAVIIAEAMLQSAKYRELLLFCDHMSGREEITVEVKRKRVQALIYLRNFSSATEFLKSSTLGDAGGPLADLNFPLLAMHSSREAWHQAFEHGAIAVQHLLWQAENDPQHCTIIRLWIQKYAEALSHHVPEDRHVRLAEIASKSARSMRDNGARPLSAFIYFEICLCAELERGNTDDAPSECISEWGTQLIERSDLTEDQRLWAISRFVSFFERDARVAMHYEKALAMALAGIKGEMSVSEATGPGWNAVFERCERLKVRCSKSVKLSR